MGTSYVELLVVGSWFAWTSLLKEGSAKTSKTTSRLDETVVVSCTWFFQAGHVSSNHSRVPLQVASQSSVSMISPTFPTQSSSLLNVRDFPMYWYELFSCIEKVGESTTFVARYRHGGGHGTKSVLAMLGGLYPGHLIYAFQP